MITTKRVYNYRVTTINNSVFTQIAEFQFAYTLSSVSIISVTLMG